MICRQNATSCPEVTSDRKMPVDNSMDSWSRDPSERAELRCGVRRLRAQCDKRRLAADNVWGGLRCKWHLPAVSGPHSPCLWPEQFARWDFSRKTLVFLLLHLKNTNFLKLSKKQVSWTVPVVKELILRIKGFFCLYSTWSDQSKFRSTNQSLALFWHVEAWHLLLNLQETRRIYDFLV